MTLVTPVLSPGRGAADTAAGWVGHLHRWRLPHRQRQQRHARVAGPRHPAAAAHCGRARWRRHGALGQRGAHWPALMRHQHPTGHCQSLRRRMATELLPWPGKMGRQLASFSLMYYWVRVTCFRYHASGRYALLVPNSSSACLCMLRWTSGLWCRWSGWTAKSGAMCGRRSASRASTPPPAPSLAGSCCRWLHLNTMNFVLTAVGLVLRYPDNDMFQGLVQYGCGAMIAAWISDAGAWHKGARSASAAQARCPQRWGLHPRLTATSSGRAQCFASAYALKLHL
jgi:hypothetical protein